MFQERHLVLGLRKTNWAVCLVQQTTQSTQKTELFLKSTGCRYLSTAFQKKAYLLLFPHNPAMIKQEVGNSGGLVRVCSSSPPILRGRRREITINDTRLEQQWQSDKKTTLYTPLVNQSRSPYALFALSCSVLAVI